MGFVCYLQQLVKYRNFFFSPSGEADGRYMRYHLKNKQALPSPKFTFRDSHSEYKRLELFLRLLLSADLKYTVYR